MSQARLLVVTGISGSGRTTCLRALEDAGWYCVDNLPARLLPGLTTLMSDRQEPQPLAVGIDVRAGAFLAAGSAKPAARLSSAMSPCSR